MSVRRILSLPLRRTCRGPEVRQLHTLPTRPHPRAACIHPQRRQASSSFLGNARALFRQHPLSISLATFAIVFAAGGFVYLNYKYQSYIVGAFHRYPEPVARKLRRALYYTNMDLQPQEAIKYYKQAIEIASEMGMDPFSDEIIGVKIQVAALMERIGQDAKAISVMEILRRDCLRWIEERGDSEGNKEKRTRLLAKCVALSIKLGELYGGRDVYDRAMAEDRLVWAVETAIKEKERRAAKMIRDEDEGSWLSDEELGAALESLAHVYEQRSQHYLATPLFLQALSLYPSKGCHSVVLMNNLATSLAQQSPTAARSVQAYATSRNINEKPSGPLPTRETLIDNATTWAQKALDVAAAITPPERTEECDVGCAVATHNLGEFAEMVDNVVEARKRYNEAISIARAIGFQEGVDNSSTRLRQLPAV